MIHIGHISAWWLAPAFYFGLILGGYIVNVLTHSSFQSRLEEYEENLRRWYASRDWEQG